MNGERTGSASDVTHSEFAIGQRLFGRYTLIRVLGRGGMGIVWLAHDEELERKVALKFLPDLLIHDAAVLSNLKRETRRCLELTHKNIVRIYDFVHDERSGCISMEYVDGDTLSSLRCDKERKIFEAAELTDWMSQLCDALGYAHSYARIIHRDLKPANLMVNQRGELKVSDFGIARSLGDSMSVITMAGGRSGTLAYMSPQQLEGERGTHLDDIYSLGATVYELLTSKPPFYVGNVDRQIREKIPPSMTERRKEFEIEGELIPAVWEEVVAACLAKDPERRPQSVSEIARRLQMPSPEARPPPVKSFFERSKKRILAFTVATLCLIALALGGWYFGVFKPAHAKVGAVALVSTATAIPEKSIAVLPFENLSSDKENAYFADGIQDEILTRLSKIADLKVISRTSTQHYKSAPENLPEIAKQLGVAHILEGRVQKSGDTVRVNVQLIKTANDSHLWADTFDRKLTDVFSVESEVAKAVADQLRAKLTSQEEEVIGAKPTNIIEAYDAYLRGLAYTLKPGATTRQRANLLGAQKYFREAVRLDPNFALSWALLSIVDARGYITTALQPTVALREESRMGAETALTLQPNLGEALMAKGFYHYGCLKDYDTAVRYFEQARQFLPNSSRIPEFLANVERRRGRWDRSESYFNEAEQLDPRNVNLLTQHAWSYINFRRFTEALRKLDEVLNITPDDVDTLVTKAAIAQAEGDLPRAAALLAPLNPTAADTATLETQVYQKILERQPAQIIPRLKEILAKPDPALGYFGGELRFWLGWAQEVAGDHAAAQESWRQARTELESFLNEQPKNYLLIGDLALTNMGLGDKAAALALSERAMDANPIERDAPTGAIPIEILARVAARLGEPDRAINALQKLLSIPYAGGLAVGAQPLTPALLRLDPMFDPLRNDSRFQELAEQANKPVAPSASTSGIHEEPKFAAAAEKSVAVLPFENLSEEKANEFFADGVQDEILTNLARIADLKVISRTSVMQYKTGTKRNLREIGQQLGVAKLVEGSVQRAGKRVRVNAHLVDAQTDKQLWGQVYDRDLADVFAIQSEIAKSIADQLQAKLSPSEEKAIELPPTGDIAAFDLYTRAKNILWASDPTQAELLQAVDLLNQAVARDSSFFDAYCQLVYVHDLIYNERIDHTAARLALAEAAIQAAARLRPDAGETHLARAQNLYWGYWDYDGALAELKIARETLPNDSRIPQLTAHIRKRQGHSEEAARYLEHAIELNPRNLGLRAEVAMYYSSLRRYADLKSALASTLAVFPNDLNMRIWPAYAEFQQKADARPLHQILDLVRATNPAATQAIAEWWLACALAERDDAAAKNALDAHSEGSIFLGNEVFFSRSFVEGLIALIQKDQGKARSAFVAARTEQEKIVQAQTDNGPPLGLLGLIDAYLGRKEEALREGRRAVELLRAEKDVMQEVGSVQNLAMIAARVGDKDLACEQLDSIIRLRSALSYGGLKLFPWWDPLRGDPRFDKLLKESKQPIAFK